MALIDRDDDSGSPLGLALLIVLGLVVLGAVGWGVYSLWLAGGKSDRKHVVQQIELVRPPPPPPAPPKQEIKPPELKKEEVIRTPEPPPPDAPKQADDKEPAGKELGLDAEGTAGGDGFGLAARKGGRDIITLGEGGGGRSGYQFYAGRLQRHLERELARDDRLRSTDYRAVVHVWLARDGRVDRVELAGPSGNPEADRRLTAALAALPAIGEPPPEGMPQPVRIRITSRAAG